MNYTEFSLSFLVAAYLEAREMGGQTVQSGDLLAKYDYDVIPMWVHTALEDWRSKGWISGRATVGDEKSQPIRLTGAGLQQAESLLDIPQIQPSMRRHSEPANRFNSFEDQFLLALYRERQSSEGVVSLGRAARDAGLEYESGWLLRALENLTGKGFVSGTPSLRYEEMSIGRITSAGMQYVEDHLLRSEEADGAAIVPAANRLVTLDHNRPEYQEIARGIEGLYEQVRQDNEVGDTAKERDRLLRSLIAAKELWSAAELHVIQIRVGVAMAVEDATNAIVKIGKAVGAALLVDLIKTFVKNATGIDL
jgi:hypothetical protein